MSEDRDQFHFLSAIAGAAVGFGILQLAAAPGIVERWPSLFDPIWGYFPWIGLIAAFVGGLVAGLLAPAGRVARSGDLAGVTVGVLVCLRVLPERPGWGMIFLVTIAYGFVGFVPGSAVAGIKSE